MSARDLQRSHDFLIGAVNIVRTFNPKAASGDVEDLVGKFYHALDSVEVAAASDGDFLTEDIIDGVNLTSKQVSDLVSGTFHPKVSSDELKLVILKIWKYLDDIINLLRGCVLNARLVEADVKAKLLDASQRIKSAESYLSMAQADREKVLLKVGELDAGVAKFEELNKTYEDSALKAKSIVFQAEQALQGASRVGLAGAFNSRAIISQVVAIVWVLILVLALGGGVWWGHSQVNELQALILSKVSYDLFVLKAAMAVLSFAAPVWMAWLATKQLTERFRISEDYAYKAAVSMAYQGYKQVASDIGEEHVGKLFDKTLDTIGQHPLRHLNSKIYGSPWHEALDTPTAMEAVKALPKLIGELKDKSLNKKSGESKKEESEAEEKKEK
ncbi:hypothetical protein [Chromobacterium violaceum]|uniref:hypothetical protein n=1 Tax=Chromobacterium violaceum TaxID=536 RepID=UPI001B33901D|nr:hypothetical protein [Chromobacterium violaceum]MBP4045977.1 hypothetical protein [Chromobacterium violaceum]